MPSPLRNQISSCTTPATSIIRPQCQSPPAKKQKMSLTQTYYLAHTARGKLSKEAARGDHELRLLVGHANLLDGLMLDLANAEREQESWFNQTVKNNTKAVEEPKHIQWADTIPEDVEAAVEEEIYGDDSDSDSDDEEIQYAQPMPVRKAPQPQATIITTEIDEDEEMEDDDFEEELTLTRTSSMHPPELLHEDSDSESEDDSMPPSPPSAELHLSQKQRHAIATTSFYQSIPAKSDSPTQIPEPEQASFFDDGYYLPQRQTAIAAF